MSKKYVIKTVEILVAEDDLEFLARDGYLEAEISSAIYQYCVQQREIQAYIQAYLASHAQKQATEQAQSERPLPPPTNSAPNWLFQGDNADLPAV